MAAGKDKFLLLKSEVKKKRRERERAAWIKDTTSEGGMEWNKA